MSKITFVLLMVAIVAIVAARPRVDTSGGDSAGGPGSVDVVDQDQQVNVVDGDEQVQVEDNSNDPEPRR